MRTLFYIPFKQIILFLLCTIAVLACSNNNTPNVETSENTKEIFPVDVTRAIRQDIFHTVEAIGSFLPEEDVDLSAETPGQVKALLVDEGSYVQKGDPLLEIDREKASMAVKESEAMLKEASARLENSTTTLHRKKKLNSTGVIGQYELDDAITQVSLNQAIVDRIKAELNSARKTLKDTRVTAPIEGIISERLVSIGEYVKVGTDLLKIVDISPLKLSFTLPEKYAGTIKSGQTVEIFVTPYPGEIFTGTIYFVSPQVDRSTRTIKIKAKVSNDDFRLKPGFFAKTTICIEKRNSLTLPESAVLVREGKIVVMAVKDNIIRYKPVETGVRFNGIVEILNGITDKDIIVAYGRNEITEGTRVQTTLKADPKTHDR